MGYKKIMIVDDSSTSRMIMKRCFFIAGYEKSEFIEAEDGLAALAILNENMVDLIVTDLNMPRMDGITFVRRLNAKDSLASIPVLIISSIGNDPVKEELNGSNVVGLIKKPLMPEKIVDILGGEKNDEEF